MMRTYIRFLFPCKVNDEISVKMYETIGANRGIPPDDRVIPLKRSEWQQPSTVLPPLHKRLDGQRRRRILGSFPETENDVNIEKQYFLKKYPFD